MKAKWVQLSAKVKTMASSFVLMLARVGQMIREPKLTMKSLARSWKSEQMRLLGAKIAKTYTAYGFQGHFDSAALQKVKRFKMDKQSVKDLMFGGINELMRNRTYYYHSTVGINYSHWTEEGQKALVEYMNVMGWKLKEAEEAELNRRAKELVIKGLKGESV